MGEPLSDERFIHLRELVDHAGWLPDREVVWDLLDMIEEERTENGRKRRQVNEQWDEIQDLRRQLAEAEMERDALRALCGDLEASDISPLRERVRDVIHEALARRQWMGVTTATVAARDLTDAVMPVIATEVTAKVSEAQVAVPPPLFTAIFEVIDGKVQLSPQQHDAFDLPAQVVAVYPRDLAEQVADRELDNEGLQRELDAMTAVAEHYRRRHQIVTTRPGENGWYSRFGGRVGEVTDAQRQALDRLSETREGERRWVSISPLSSAQ